MKIFADKELTQEIISVFNLGIVPAGEVKSFTFWIINNENSLLKKLNFFVDHQEVRIIKAPEELIAHAVDELILEWSPSVTLKEGLEARLRVQGIELWG